MNILYLSADRGIPVRGGKGAAVHIRAMCRALTRLGHRVTLVTPRPGPKGGQPVEARLLPLALPVLTEEQTGTAGARELQARRYTDLLVDHGLKLLKTGRYDMVYERYSLWSDAAARLQAATGVPAVLEVNAPLRLEAARHRTLIHEREAAALEVRQFAGVAAVVAVSDVVARYVVEHGGDEERVHVMPNGVDPDQFHPGLSGGSVHDRYNLHDRRVVGFVGTARPWHDLDTLLRAFARLHDRDPRFHLLLVGKMGPDLVNQVAHLKLQGAVTMTGPVPHDQVPDHIAAMTVAVSPHRQMDDFYFSPLKLFEYLACGVPVVAADLGQVADVVKPGLTGELYRAGDVDSLAGRIYKLVHAKAYASNLGWRGAELVLKNFTWEHNARSVVSLVQMGATRAISPGVDGGFSGLPLLDSKLKKRLYRATRLDLAEANLWRCLPKSKRDFRLAGIEVLKYKPGRRCVLRYTWTGTNGSGNLLRIGKVFKDDRGRKLDAVQRVLYENGLGKGAQIRVPRAMGYLPKMRMQLQEAVSGETLNDLYRETEIAPWIPLCAQGLVRLHELERQLPASARRELANLIGVYRLPEERSSLRETHQVLVEHRPADRLIFDQLHAALEAHAQVLAPQEEDVLVHRDFYYSQVMVKGSRLTIIDLDLIARGDAAIDVANFSAHLNFLGLETKGDFRALDGAAAVFKATYQALRPQPESFWDRVAFYESATLFRLLRVVVVRPRKEPIYSPLLSEVLKIKEPVT